MQESNKGFIHNNHKKQNSVVKNNRNTVMLNSRISRKINLLTYNVFMRPPLINNNGNDYKNKRLQYIIDNVLSFYDVICLQEMFHFGSNRRNFLLDEAHKAGFKHAYTSPIPCFLSGIDGGLVILSRFPIVKAAETTFASGIHSDKLCHKGILYCKIKVEENFHFHIFTTHTQASYESNLPLTEPSVQIRLEQIGEARRFIAEQIKDQPTWEPVALLGDLNVNSRYDLREDTPTSTQEYIIMHQILCGGDLTEIANPNTKAQTLNFRDLLYDTLGHHPITFADFVFDTNSPTGGTPRETILTSKESLGNCESLDYIFYLDRNDSNNNAAGSSEYYLELGPARVEPMFLPNPTPDFPCTQLSDHYGVSLEMIVTPKPPSTRDASSLLTPPQHAPPEVGEETESNTSNPPSRSSSSRGVHNKAGTPPSPVRKVSSSRRRISKVPQGAEDIAQQTQ